MSGLAVMESQMRLKASAKVIMKKRKYIKAKYVSDEPLDFFEKGKIYDKLFYPVDDSRKCIICYIDEEGEEYGISADCFEVIEEYQQSRMHSKRYLGISR